MKSHEKDWKEVAWEVRRAVADWFWDLYDAGEIDRARLVAVLAEVSA